MNDNFSLITPILDKLFKDITIPISFHISVLQRSKDGHEKAATLIAEWFVGSIERFALLKPAIIALCKEYNARCYINLNPKSDEAVSWKMLRALAERLETSSTNFKSLASHCHDSCQGYMQKYWLVDIDNPSVDVEELSAEIKKCETTYDEVIVEKIPTKNGTHLITMPFNTVQLKLPEGVEVKKNNATLLYWNIDEN